MNQDKCTIQVNGVEVEARPGQMLIEVTDAIGSYVPRFCYHEKLSIAANCRMCLVEVENAPKPLPACATPVAPGMKVHTRSAKAIGAQKATMEFLLINHPLDCPICDQGGECELQDLAMGFGRDVARYAERKRTVRDKNIGPLVSTDMTRCIHCTRCVRFTQEIAGFQELGTIGRGDRVEISPYIERAISHELSGNIIDLCPVGALNSKPYRFSARAWEMSQQAAIAPHDCLGSNVHAHVLGGRIKRIVPRPCEAINETWLSDRDRFSYEGLYSDDRVSQPMVREDTGWRGVGWDEALDLVARGLRSVLEQEGPSAIGALVSPSATVEEGYLLSRLMDQIGSANLDHRLRRRDVRDQVADPLFPWLGLGIDEVEALEQVVVIGSNLRKEVPLLAHRVRKAAMAGAGVHFINPSRFRYLFPVADYLEGTPGDFWLDLAAVVRAAADGSSLSSDIAALVEHAPPPAERHRKIVVALRAAPRALVLVGALAINHPNRSVIVALARELARVTDSRLGYLSDGANSAGLALAGVLPHRAVGGEPRDVAGADAGQILAVPPRGLLLFGVEPEHDCSARWSRGEASGQGGMVVALSPFLSDWTRKHADVFLPIATAYETSGTFVNVEGRWQSFAAAAVAPGEGRPGWKVLRVLGDRLGLSRNGYASSEAIRDELRQRLSRELPDNLAGATPPPGILPTAGLLLQDLDVPLYRVDALVRRATSLQETADARGSIETERERRSA